MMIVTVQNRVGMIYTLSALDEQRTTVSTSTRGVAKQITLDLPLDDVREYWGQWAFHGVSVQYAFRTLTPEEREFLMTGTTPAEWAEMFPRGEER